MRRHFRHALTAATIGAAGLAFPAAAPALERHADASSTTKAEACKFALSLARQEIAGDRVTASHCECMENKEEPSAPWSCQAFVTYR
jgi:hypothetical protein